MDDLAREIVNSINISDFKSSINSKVESENFFEFNNDNYHDILKLDLSYYKNFNYSSAIAFIDGGQTILIDSPRMCASILRIGYVAYENNARISSFRKDYQIFIIKKQEGFFIKTFPETDFDKKIIASEQFLRNSSENNSDNLFQTLFPVNVLSIIRKCLEIDLAHDLHSKFTNLVLDGSLDYNSIIEKNYLKKLTTINSIIAISKTSNITFDNGESIQKKLYRPGCWYYYPIIKNSFNSLFDTSFAKLHDSSKHIFRIDANKSFFASENSLSDTIHTNLRNIFSLIKNNSKDPIFLGYPYGLIDVDQYVRISEEESEYFKIKLVSKLGVAYKNILLDENSTNAHSILDNIKF